jgi:hypothetical protein
MRELKKGEIKQILVNQAEETIPDFDLLTYRNNCYTFQRQKNIGDIVVYELFHIIFSLKDRHFSCSVASRLSKALINNSSYNTGIINPHKDLIVQKKGTGAINISDAYYYHDGNFETIIIVVKEIFEDFKKYGISFLNNQIGRLLHNQIISVGLAYIKSLYINQETVLDKVVLEKLQQELKERLFAVEGQTRDDRKEIVRTARELMDLYLEKQGPTVQTITFQK